MHSDVFTYGVGSAETATAALHRLSDTGDVRALLEWLSVRS